MAIGTYEVANVAGYGDAYFGTKPLNYSSAQRVSFTGDVSVKSVFFYYGSANTNASGGVKFQIFKASDGSLITNQSITVTTTVGWQEVEIIPVTLTSGVEYSIGFYTPNPGTTAVAYDTTGTGVYQAGQSTPAGIVSSWWGSIFYNTTNAETTMPSTSVTDSLMIKLSVDATPATGVTVTNSPVPNGTIPLVSWTQTGQTKYQMRWRKIS